MTSPERLLDRFEAPLPPDSLRARSLAAAKAAMAASVGRTEGWTRLWRSRAARLAWAATVAVLVAAHALLSVPAPSTSSQPRSPFVLAGSTHDPELAAMVALPRLRSGRLPQLDVAARSEPAHRAGRSTPRSDSHDA